MAKKSKVNTKFVVLLSAGAIVIVGVLAGMAYFIALRSASDLANSADKKLAEGSIEAAELLYSKAVNKEQTNIEALEKWRDCLAKWTPETRAKLEGKYTQAYVPALRQISLVKATDIAAHQAYLGEMWGQMANIDPPRGMLDHLANETTRILNYFKSQPEDGPWNVLKRYRGLVMTRAMAGNGDVKPEEVEQAKADLLAALKADPKDAESAIAMHDWHLSQARQAQERLQKEEAAKLKKQGVDFLREFAKTSDSQSVLGLVLIHDLESAQLAAVAGKKDNKAAVEAVRAATETLRPRLDEVAKAFQSPEALTLLLPSFQRFQQLEQTLDPESRLARTTAVADDLVKRFPENSALHLMRARMLGTKQAYPEAIAAMDQIKGLPAAPIGQEAVRRFVMKTEATFWQASYSLRMLDRSTEEADRQRLIGDAIKYRQELAGQVPDGSPQLKMIDGMVAYARKDWATAHRLLSDYSRAINDSDVDALWSLANASLALQRPGEARDYIAKVREMLPSAPGPLVLAAQIEAQLGNREIAAGMVQAVLDVDPTNAQAKEVLNKIKMVKGEEAEGGDPITAILLKAQKMATGEGFEAPNVPEAVEMLVKAVRENKYDLRLVNGAVRGYARLGQKANAIALVDEAAKARPDDKDLPRLKAAMESEDPVVFAINEINTAADIDDFEKALARYNVYRGAGRTAEARGELLAADKLKPDQPEVIEQLFNLALETEQHAEAATYVQKGESKNIDGLNGKFWRARLLSAQGDHRESVRIVESMIQGGGTFPVELHRFLGRELVLRNRVPDAIRAFDEALRIRPNDVGTLVDVISVLAENGRGEEALLRARNSSQVARDNDRFFSLWLNLEAQAGNRDFAIDAREKVAEREPTNRSNRIALAIMYIDKRDFEKSRPLIDALRKEADELRMALIDARWYVEQRQGEAALKIINDYLATLTPKTATFEPFVLAGQFVAERGDVKTGLEIMERGRPYQDAKLMEVDRSIADLLTARDMRDQAADYYRRVVDAGADGPKQEVRLRLAEIYSMIGRHDDAKAMIDGVTYDDGGPDLSLLRGDLARRRGDAKAAREAFDQAVAKFASSPLVYVRRGQFAQSEDRNDDAMGDFDAALRINATDAFALQARAALHQQMGHLDKALADLRQALKGNQSLDGLRQALMGTLIDIKRGGEAEEVADEAVKARPNDSNLRLGLGQVFMAKGEWLRAQRFLSQAWSIDKRVDIAYAFLSSLLNGTDVTPAAQQDAEGVLRELGPKVDENADLLVSRAKLFSIRGRKQEAERDLAASLGKVDFDDVAKAVGWMSEARRIIPKVSELASILEVQTIQGRARLWANFYRGSVLMEDPAQLETGLSLLGEVIAADKEPAAVQLSYRLLGSGYFGQKKYDQATKTWGDGLKRFPNDWEMNNNLAYALAKYLKKYEEAKVHALAATKLNTTSGDAWDTLGYIHLMLGELPEADKALDRAAGVVRSPNTTIAVFLHYGELRVAQNQMDKARELVTAVETLLGKNPELKTVFQADLDDLKSKIK
ncbi:MAG: tetratricopeptide repeat protein [Phycisphaerae bacterium]|nr:tetratricopeptide repeat protein [Phycisphaerae bacterium]